jgi:pimeloyl-ACP methyl ester carboxylesterase
MKEYKTSFVTSKDGAKINYRQLGTGPGLILVHGGLMASQNFMQLAKILSKEFTVYIPDRQGRGLSDKREAHGLAAECEDVAALAEKTNSQNVFGLSSGAIVTLQTAITFSSIKKIALYEPPISIEGTKPEKWYQNYEDAILKENFGKAFINILRGTGAASLLTIFPVFITAPLMSIAIKRERKEINTDNVSLKSLLKAFKYDYTIVKDSEGILDRIQNLKVDVLLIGGSKSQYYLKAALDKLHIVLPKAKRVTLQGIGHLAADNSGKPEMVADELIKFF